MKEIFGQSAASALIRVLGMLLSLLVVVIMAQTLGPEDYGVYTYVLSLVAILSIPVKLGLPTLVTRETAVAMADGDTARIWKLWLWAHRIVLILGVLVLIALFGWLALTTYGDQGTRRIWIWGGLLVPILALGNLRSAALRGLGYVLLSQVPETILRPVFIVILAFGFYVLLGDGFSAEQAMMLNLIGSALVFLVGIGLMIGRAPPRPPGEIWPRDRVRTRPWLTSALTLGLAMGTQNLGGNMDVIMLNMFTGSYEVGLYKVAMTGGSLVSFGLLSINMILMSRVAGLYSKGNLSDMQSLVTAASRLALLFTLLASIFLAIFGQWLLVSLFGPEYASSYLTLLIIAAGYLMGAVFGVVMLVINMTRNEKSALFGAIGFALINVLLNAVLIPLAGKEGAAIATAVSLIIFNIYLWYIVLKQTRINTFALYREA